MHRSHPSFWISWYRTMVDGFLHIVSGLLTILTLGIVSKDFTFWWVFRCGKKDIAKKIKERSNE